METRYVQWKWWTYGNNERVEEVNDDDESDRFIYDTTDTHWKIIRISFMKWVQWDIVSLMQSTN